jgi:peroxiredoxin
MVKRSLCGMLAIVLSLAASGCYAEKLKIGEAAPEFTGIIGTDDQSHSLPEYKDAKAVLVVFTCNQCPVAKAYEDRLVAIQKDYAPKGVQVIAINVNKNEGNDLAAMKERAKDKSFNFPYLFDASQKSARNYGAVCTPHVFVLDKDRKLAYVGAIDDSMEADKVETSYVRDALDAVLAGKTPTKTETRPTGCGIHYE